MTRRKSAQELGYILQRRLAERDSAPWDDTPLWERALMALTRPWGCLSRWLWGRGAARAIERRNRLNTPWDRSAP